MFTDEIDVVLPTRDPEKAADLPGQLVLHVGAAAVPVRVRMLLGDGDTLPDARFARLLLDRPLPLLRGERGVLRDPGGQRVAAGVVVADLAPPGLRRRGAARARALELSDGLDPVREVERRGASSRRMLDQLGILPVEAPLPDGLREVGGLVVGAVSWAGWSAGLQAAVDVHAAESPLQPGLPLETARQRVGLPDLAVLPELAADSGLVLLGGQVRRPDAGPHFSAAALAGLDEVRARLQDNPFAAPEADELTAAGLDAGTIAAAAKLGQLLRLSGGVVLLPEAEDEAVVRLAKLEQPFTTSQARVALDTTRRVAIPLLEHLDSKRRTRRIDATTRTVLR
jgi:selenocysteine-specific elongation factor